MQVPKHSGDVCASKEFVKRTEIKDPLDAHERGPVRNGQYIPSPLQQKRCVPGDPGECSYPRSSGKSLHPPSPLYDIRPLQRAFSSACAVPEDNSKDPASGGRSCLKQYIMTAYDGRPWGIVTASLDPCDRQRMEAVGRSLSADTRRSHDVNAGRCRENEGISQLPDRESDKPARHHVITASETHKTG